MKRMDWIKVLVSIALLWLVFSRIDVAEAAEAARRLGPAALLPALGLALAAYVPRAWRWQMLLRRSGIALSLAGAYRLTLVGVLYGIATPGRIGELARVAHLPPGRLGAVPSVLWDRLSDVVLLELLAVPGLIAVGGGAPWLWWIWLAITGATVLLPLVLRSPRLQALAVRRFPALGRLGFGGSDTSPRVPVAGVFIRSLGAGLLFYAINFTSAFVLLRGIAPEAPAAIILVFPLIILLGNLPIAFGGLGVREYFAAVAFAGLGAGSETGPVFSLAWFGVMSLLPGVAGFVAFRVGERLASRSSAAGPIAGAAGRKES